MADSEVFLDKDLLQRLQDRFCVANNMYLICLGRDAGVMTKNFGSEEEIAYIHQIADMDRHARLLRRLLDNPVEHVIEEALQEDYLKMCGVSVPVNGKSEIIWIAVAILKEKLTEEAEVPESVLRTTEEGFYHSISFLETLSRQLVAIKQSELQAQKAYEISRLSEEELKLQLRESEAMTAMVTLLEADNEFTEIATELLRICVGYLAIDGGFLLQEKQDHTVEIISCFRNQTADSGFEDMNGRNRAAIPFFNGKPYMISTDTPLPQSFMEFFRSMNWKAGVFLPIELKNGQELYIGFFETEKRVWTVEEIKFINDAKRVAQSILLRRITQNSLASSYASLDGILEYAGCGIVVWDRNKQEELYTNRKFDEIIGQDEDNQVVSNLIEQGIKLLSGKTSVEVYLEERDRWLDISKTNIEWVDGREVLLGTIYDITDKKRYQRKIEQQANNDFLTGLYNRMRCELDIGEALAKAKESGKSGAVLLLDLDDFKQINDGLGMQYGDVLLKAVSKSIQEIVPEGCGSYRMGGDEFVILLTPEACEEMDEICQEIQAVFAKPWYLKGGDYYCTMSMGVVRYPEDGNTVENLIQKADSALFEAKRQGKNRIYFYSQANDTEAHSRLDMEKHMRNATQNSCKEFEVYYQPIFKLNKSSLSCCGAEALVRWNSASMGFMRPDEFIPLAEYLGLINPIGDYVLREAAKHCKYWNDLGHPEYKVNVNLSVVQLLQKDIIERIKKVLEDTHINPANLTLEVTESLAINDLKRMKKILGQLKELGMTVALDDFGTGYSSLNHVKDLPIDIIKIDRSFMEQVENDSFSKAFAKMVNELASSIEMTVCMEGIEHREQLEIAEETGIQYVQGFYFDMPLTKEEFDRKYM